MPESARRNPQNFADEDKYRRLWVERGKDEEQLEIYKSYSMDTLKALSEDGDVYATMALAEENDHWLFKTDLKRFQALSEQEQQQALLEVEQESLRLRRLAAAQGSTQAISSLFYEKGSLLHLIENEGFGRSADYHRRVYGYDDPAVPLEWELAMDAAALAVVLGRRGDVTFAQVNLSALAKDYGFEVTLTDWPEILNRADTFYSEIARQRSSLGLEPFDNSVVSGYNGNYRGEPNHFYSNLSPDRLPELELR
ncbi:hypothetical protein [Gilvimarinus sp. DA14]|uniref:hypothetical protein n=1 Tax=Gilvimarinus sp. DA14 TaxID=2956798 RepID=UPI0020B6F402|nr:hypothetical protein [Gilvimarinus sp. DA14]UTF59261.1 hypothetical protein NHM04_12330 [Gilvimarinus sp. DA14]